MRSVYMFGKAPIKFSPQTEGINLRPAVDGGSALTLENSLKTNIEAKHYFCFLFIIIF
ncbi:hypothetical protein T01_1134, partial [Trichinella spiralis]